MPSVLRAPGGGGAPGDPTSTMALDVLGQLSHRTPNPTAALATMRQGLDLMHKIAMALLPQVTQINPKVAKDLHAIGQRVLSAKSDLVKDMPLAPPPDLMQGLGAGGPAPLLSAPSQMTGSAAGY